MKVRIGISPGPAGAPGQFAETVLRCAAPQFALVRESQIIVSRLFEHDHVYVLQQPGGELVFAQRYDEERTLIGMARAEFRGDLAAIAARSRGDEDAAAGPGPAASCRRSWCIAGRAVALPRTHPTSGIPP